MATRAFTRLPKSLPSDLLRGGLPQLGRFGAGSCHRRPGESREDDRYARAQDLVAQTRSIHLTRRNESTVLIAGAGIAASAMIARYGIKEYRKYQDAQPKGAGESNAPDDGTSAAGRASTASTEGAAASASNFFGAFGKRHYEGGFDDKMTRREAALILGVRESAAPQRIKESHRRILMINHPDKGGSKYMAAKINEAKELLLKGRGR